MIMIRAIIRPEKTTEVLTALSEAGFPAVTKVDVVGRGKQKGVRFGDIYYDEIPKEMLLFIVNDEDRNQIVKIIMDIAKTGEEGAFGDGKIFISPVEAAYTVSSNTMEL